MIYEVWYDIPGVPGYEASSFGRIANNRTGQVLRSQRESDGRHRLSLRPYGNRKRFLVHKLVMWAFVGDCPEGYEVNHIDGDHCNNVLTNLEYITKRANYDHAIRLGLHDRNENHRTCKLSNADVLAIREVPLDSPRGTWMRLAEKYGVSNTLIINVRRGKVRKYASNDWATMEEIH